jgi:hypothetical protein
MAARSYSIQTILYYIFQISFTFKYNVSKVRSFYSMLTDNQDYHFDRFIVFCDDIIIYIYCVYLLCSNTLTVYEEEKEKVGCQNFHENLTEWCIIRLLNDFDMIISPFRFSTITVRLPHSHENFDLIYNKLLGRGSV